MAAAPGEVLEPRVVLAARAAGHLGLEPCAVEVELLVEEDLREGGMGWSKTELRETHARRSLEGGGDRTDQRIPGAYIDREGPACSKCRMTRDRDCSSCARDLAMISDLLHVEASGDQAIGCAAAERRRQSPVAIGAPWAPWGREEQAGLPAEGLAGQPEAEDASQVAFDP